jgi:hypothetical protein
VGAVPALREAMLPKPATFVLEPGDRFFHQLLVVSVIKIHPLGLQLFQGSQGREVHRLL